MMVMVLLAVSLVAVVAVCAWPAIEDWKAADAAGAPGKDAAQAADTVVARPESLEGVLVRQLLNREISGRQYLSAMSMLAQRDADRHPLSVPPDD